MPRINDNGTINPGSGQATGAHPAGLIIYTPTGYMSADIMSTTPEDRPEGIKYPAQAGDSDHDWALVGRHTFSYAGNFSVQPWNETHGNLTHGPLGYALVPSMVGTNQSRNYTFYEGNNILRLQARNETSKTTGSLFWRRATPRFQSYGY